MTVTKFEYDPSLPIMEDLIAVLRKLEDALILRDEIVAPIIGSSQLSSNMDNLQDVVDSADKIVLSCVKRFVDYLDEVELIAPGSHRIMNLASR